MNARAIMPGLRRRGGPRALFAGALLAAMPALSGRPARAWEPETHVGLTQRAVQRSGLDGALRRRGLDGGLHEILGLRPEAPGTGARLDDHALLGELTLVDAAFGASPDGTRAPALTWILAGAVLEGSRVDRLRNHFIDPVHGGGLDERERYLALRVRYADPSQGGVGRFDGTGLRADRWADAPATQNPLSRARLLDELYLADSAPTAAERSAALARALICTGAILHVLEAVGAPAHARGDFVVNYTVAGRPVERWAQTRYGLLPPAPSTAVAPRTQLARFFTSPDGTGLADEVARAHASPGTLPPNGAPLSPEHIRAAVDSLLPRIAAESAALLDFLFRGALELVTEKDADGPRVEIRVGSLALGKGEIALFIENEGGTRQRVLARPTDGGAVGHSLLALAPVDLQSSAIAGARRLVAIYRGVDAAGEPIVLSQVSAR